MLPLRYREEAGRAKREGVRPPRHRVQRQDGQRLRQA